MFLGGGNACSHVSRVSSPLGHSFIPNPPSTHWPGNDIGTFSNPNTPVPGFGMHESFVLGNFGSSNLENSRNYDVGSHIPNGLVQNGTTDRPAHYQSPQNKPQEYRDLMPQPRTLPFESSKKGYKVGGRPDPQETKRLEAVKARKPRKTGTATHSIVGTTARSPKKVRTTRIARKKVDVKQLQSSERDVTPGKTTVQSGPNHKLAVDALSLTPELEVPSKVSKKDIYEDAQCQTDMQSEPSSGGRSLKTAASIEQPTGPDVSPLVVVTDPDTLKDLHEATTMLFEEYEKGVEHCGDQVRHAELYLHRIWEKRRDFWLERLRDNTDV
ncbi:hypothetical protein FSPOR_789 [Fusarium sporotrichioides]|uniref:Uncharacterized protein n=1 Tax=Fusarium sporotrichioides TaxID=5514 RepID=A0A395SSK6_FUSSP|nr:hypothetical protein FSPOR_789 [Fusarium sporotrichioides]